MKLHLFLLVSSLTVSGFALAGQGLYRCEGVADNSEWTIEVDLRHGEAWLFDNDTLADAKLASVRSLESFPPQTVYSFESTARDARGRYSLEFNETRRNALITLLLNNEVTTLEFLNCKAVRKLVLK